MQTIDDIVNLLENLYAITGTPPVQLTITMEEVAFEHLVAHLVVHYAGLGHMDNAKGADTINGAYIIKVAGHTVVFNCKTPSLFY